MVVKEWVARQHSNESKNEQRNFLPEFSLRIEGRGWSPIFFLKYSIFAPFFSAQDIPSSMIFRVLASAARFLFHPGSEPSPIQRGVN